MTPIATEDIRSCQPSVVSVDQIQDIEVLRILVMMQLQERARLKAQLADALTQLHAKDGAQAEQLALELDRMLDCTPS